MAYSDPSLILLTLKTVL